MALSYTAKSEEQLIKEGLFPDGEYDCEVIDASDALSKKTNNPMLTLTLSVFHPEGRRTQVTDYISFGSNFGERKFRKSAAAFGLEEQYIAGKLAHTDYENRAGKVILAQTDGLDGYPAKNIVKEYLPKTEGAEDAIAAAKKAFPGAESKPLDDEIPF